MLRDLLDSIEPHFTHGGKLERLYPIYELIDTFLYTPADVTKNAAHVRDSIDLKRMMITVIAALMPCIVMALWNTGYQANLALAELGLESAGGVRGAILDIVGVGIDPASVMANLLHGALYFVPVFIVCNMVGGF